MKVLLISITVSIRDGQNVETRTILWLCDPDSDPDEINKLMTDKTVVFFAYDNEGTFEGPAEILGPRLVNIYKCLGDAVLVRPSIAGIEGIEVKPSRFRECIRLTKNILAGTDQ